MRISLVVAVAKGGVIGRDNAVPWRAPEDLKFFKRITTGRPVIMGRKTYESIGRPLPNRLNIVVSRDPAYRAEGVATVTSLEAALARAASAGMGDEAMVIGGQQIFEAVLPRADRVYLTEIDVEVEGGDTFFPELSPREWREVARTPHPGPPPMRFVTLDRAAA